MEIRQEQPKDYKAVYHLVQQAFSQAEHRDGNEQDLVEALRKSDAFIPALSMVAEEGNRIVGYILFTKATIERQTVLALAPLAVLPGYQRRGIGLAMMAQGHETAARLGFVASVVLGSPDYYSKAGYQPASRWGIYPPFEVPDENFMALLLRKDASIAGGVVKYAKEFLID